MSKIDIDKLFRDQFLEHEKNSSSYSPYQWKNFEQLLDKKTGKNKKKGLGFSLNNLLFFMSAFVIVMLSPLLFLHSDNAKEPTVNIEKISITSMNTAAAEMTILKPGNDGCAENESANEVSEAGNANYTTPVINSNNGNASQTEMNKADLSYNTSIPEKQETEAILFVPVKSSIVKDTSAFLTANSVKAKKEIKKSDTVITSKKGKIKRSKILLPHFYYNGF
jgi:hypothetical protein